MPASETTDRPTDRALSDDDRDSRVCVVSGAAVRIHSVKWRRRDYGMEVIYSTLEGA